MAGVLLVAFILFAWSLWYLLVIPKREAQHRNDLKLLAWIKRDLPDVPDEIDWNAYEQNLSDDDVARDREVGRAGSSSHVNPERHDIRRERRDGPTRHNRA